VTRELELPLKNTAFEVVLDSDLPEFDGKSKPKKITKSTKKITLNPRTAVVLKAVK
jgi:hypothetical protein